MFSKAGAGCIGLCDLRAEGRNEAQSTKLKAQSSREGPSDKEQGGSGSQGRCAGVRLRWGAAVIPLQRGVLWARADSIGRAIAECGRPRPQRRPHARRFGMGQALPARHLAAPGDGRTPIRRAGAVGRCGRQTATAECGRPRPQRRPHARRFEDWPGSHCAPPRCAPGTGALRSDTREQWGPADAKQRPRSAAVPGRSDVRTHGGLGIGQALTARHLAAPGDGRTPSECPETPPRGPQR